MQQTPKIVIYELLNGRKVMAQEIEPGVIEYAFEMRVSMDNKGNASVSFVPMTIFSKSDRIHGFNMNLVLFPIEPEPVFREQYLSFVQRYRVERSGLIIAGGK